MDKGTITIRYLQQYLKKKRDISTDCSSEAIYIKLVEEVGELARAVIRGGRHATGEEDIKNTLEEEVFDVLYYLLAFANANQIDLETWIPIKETFNNRRYPSGMAFDPQDESVYAEE